MAQENPETALFFLLQPVLLHPPIQRRTADAQLLQHRVPVVRMLTEGTAQFPLLVAADNLYLLLRCAARALRVQQLLHKIRVHAVGARQQKRLLEEN